MLATAILGMGCGKNNMTEKIEELYKNQNNIIDAIKNLNERLETIEDKLDDNKFNEVNEILSSQAKMR